MASPRRLTAKQEAFAQHIADGKEMTEAYTAAYGCSNSSRTTRKANASREAAKPHVAARISELRNRVAAPRFLTRERKRELLGKFVEKGAQKGDYTPEQLKALEIDNRMAGHNEPDEVNVFGLGDLLTMVRRKGR